jgi:membrane protease YdiL (CAAX protease family)
VLGAAVYLLPGAPSGDPIVLVNGFAQVLPVSAAEVLVCWSVVGAALEASWRSRRTPILPAALLASALFGLYHLAHSPPFNT